jgi:hypothetical protein
MQVHLGFDMGIRNLAYCLIRHEVDKSWNILSWDNIDLLEGGVSSQAAKKCIACGACACWIGNDGKKWCKGCATQTRVRKIAREKPTLPTIPCAVSATALRALAIECGVDAAKKMKKDALVAWATERYLMPWKPAKAMDSSLGDILRAMDRWLDSMLSVFSSATLIRLENQPVMKGPTMKSVQIILYTLLSHRLSREYAWNGRIEFVHAGTKTRSEPTVSTVDLSGAAIAATAAATAAIAEDGKAYRARKAFAEEETVKKLAEKGAATWLTYFQGKSKKSDLADAFLMALRSS